MTRAFDHIGVPGFGCTYVSEYAESSSSVSFGLHFRPRGETLVGHAQDGPVLVFGIEAAQADFSAGRQSLSFDYKDVLLIPANVKWQIRSRVLLLKVVTVEFHSVAVQRAITEFGINPDAFSKAVSQPCLVARSTWINEVCHRYIFERSVARKPDGLSASFLENELLKEIFYAVTRAAKSSRKSRPEFARLPAAMQRALMHVEEHLFEDLDLKKISAAAITSEPTLVRMFKAHLGVPPIKYLRTRRLQEAGLLLACKRFTIAEVADMVGYRDVSSFSHAWRMEFGRPPSSVLSRG